MEGKQNNPAVETVLSLSTMLMISASFMKRNMPSCGIIIRKFVL